MRNGSLCLKLPNIQVFCGTSKIYPRHFIFRQYITTTSVQVLHTLPIKSKMMKKISLPSAHLSVHGKTLSNRFLLFLLCVESPSRVASQAKNSGVQQQLKNTWHLFVSMIFRW